MLHVDALFSQLCCAVLCSTLLAGNLGLDCLPEKMALVQKTLIQVGSPGVAAEGRGQDVGS